MLTSCFNILLPNSSAKQAHKPKNKRPNTSSKKIVSRPTCDTFEIQNNKGVQFEALSQRSITLSDSIEPKFKKLGDMALYLKLLGCTIVDKNVSNKTVKDFVNAFSCLTDLTPLKIALDSGYEIGLLIGQNPPSHIQEDKVIVLYQHNNGKNNVYSFAHELGHVFNCCTPVKFLLNYDKNSMKYADPNNNEIDEYNFCNLPKSAGVTESVEFLEAIEKDLKKMIISDQKRDKPYGCTIRKIARNYDNNNLGYYIGAYTNSDFETGRKFKSEIFAQLTAIATSKKTAKQKSSDVALINYFPETYKFIKWLLVMSDKLS